METDKKIKTQETTISQKQIFFLRLAYQALPEMWTFQILATIVLAIPAYLLTRAINLIASLDGNVITTANVKMFIFSWRFPVILILGILLVFFYLVIELFAQIYLTNDILTGQRAGVRKSIAQGFQALRSFMDPRGIMTIIFIFIAVPLCGVGFSLSISRSFYIPNFIMEVVLKTPLYAAAYIGLIIFFVWVAYRAAFMLHAVLLDGMTPEEARVYSFRLVKEHRGDFLKKVVLSLVFMFVIIFLSNVLFAKIPGWILGDLGENLPKNYRIDFGAMVNSGKEFSETDIKVIVYRILASFAVMVEKYLFAMVTFLCGAYFMLRLNRFYLEYSRGEQNLWPERPKKSRYIWKIGLIIATFAVFAVFSVYLGCFYNSIFTRKEPVKIVAHRAGGTMASENSIEGLEKAIEHGCYACEIDVQRTKDGYYIINHDNDFKRLTGVDKAPQDMTMDEIRELRIQDTTGNGQELPVVTLEEMLDVIKGRVKLFVELKGATADEKMVDDVVELIRQHDCMEDTALISLDYNVIKYAETNYPEFETGTLFFASLGDVSKLSCDLLIMEEETATNDNIQNIHDGGKMAIVWTVNTELGMYKFLGSNIDAVITDEIEMAEEIQAILDDRTDLQVLEDELELE